MFFTSCGFSQKYQVKESFLYPNIFSEEVYSSTYPIEIISVGSTLLIRDSVREYTVERGKYLERVPMIKGGHLNVYEAKVGGQALKIGFWYSKKGQFLAIQLKQGYRIVVFIIDYETESL